MATYSRTQGHNLPDIPTISYDTDIFDNRQALVLPDVPTINYDTDIFDNRQALVLPVIPQIQAYSQLGTALAVDKVFLYDASVPSYTDLTTAANEDTANDVPILPSPVGADDKLLIGSLSLFQRCVIHMGTAGIGTYTLKFEYWNGAAWTTLPTLYNAIVDCKYTNSLSMAWELPANWALKTENTYSRYWLSVGYVSGTMTTQALGSRIWIGNLINRTPLCVYVYDGANWVMVRFIYVYNASWGIKTPKIFNSSIWK
jgi:hypothetical protein